MAITRHLNQGESVVFHTRTHPKKILLPVVVLIVAFALAVFLSIHTHGVARTVVWVVALVVVLVFTVWPILNWASATYTVTNRRLFTRSGVFTRRGHDIPLNRISDVSSERDVLDRMLGCGTLVISDASTKGRVALPDVPHVEQRQLQLSDLLFAHAQGDEGT
ncbi:MAG TPA: PH domain-containing protein [Marmoricola sp.]